MQYKINVGDRIPRFKAKDQEGFEYTEEDLLGGPTVIYFYPKDDTPGCTKEACSFRDHLPNFDTLSVVVLGVSPDHANSHQAFIQKHKLNFTLLCDEHLDLAKKFDVLREKVIEGKKTHTFERTTFVVDAQGVIRWIERPVAVDKHVERVLEALKPLIAT